MAVKTSSPVKARVKARVAAAPHHSPPVKSYAGSKFTHRPYVPTKVGAAAAFTAATQSSTSVNAQVAAGTPSPEPSTPANSPLQRKRTLSPPKGRIPAKYSPSQHSFTSSGWLRHALTTGMGKRKKSGRKPTGPRKREPLATSFRCNFCNNENSVSVSIDKKAGVGNLSCKQCGQTFQTGINYLTEAVDVYADWVDACEAVKKDAAAGRGTPGPASRPRQQVDASAARLGSAPGEQLTEEDRGFIDDEDEDAEADYADD
ncbi:hypothetical protein BDY17DRAFT_264852 [Neohortaea acidophila]|uniref:Transcription elongation factor 1 homolog n=1 Tax=Neohortaea acidophila TaxID=245834 RepID=A0A6A6PY49_9PEZI|nr:uncharacterized protein BDY17DRAFT_264852 [Neohortaea acidophila]KAF2484696.1 hypothetical protein BDY17DRAFT_264852 [Neohortaea acidophila]